MRKTKLFAALLAALALLIATLSCSSESGENTPACKAGQIVLADGSLAEPGSYTAIDTANPPVAVVAGFNDNGEAFAVGLHKSSSSLQWASSDSTGYETKFSDIMCSIMCWSSVWYQSGVADTATFTGDTDGSDNWSVICSVDPEGSEEAAANYPAFNWANTYGATYADKLGSVTEGWYMPSLAELCHVYRNREAINATLSVINKLNSSYADSSLGTSLFWSSSQSNGTNGKYSYAWVVDFSDGDVSDLGGKSAPLSVLAVRVLRGSAG